MFFILTQGKQQGPFNVQQLVSMVAAGELTRDTYVWKNGMATWDFAKNTELYILFENVPPVPPTPPSPPSL